MLTSVSEITYSTTNSSNTSTYSVMGGVFNTPSTDTTASDNFAKSLLGNNCKKVDITANGVLNDLATPNMNTYSMNSTTNSSTLFSMEVDAIGNMTKFNGYDFNWNGRRLESISQDGVELISYKYNIDGQRVSKTVGNSTTEYFYNGDILAGQKTGNDVLIFMYDNNGDVFGFTYNGTPYYYIKNAQNDVYMIVDETGVAYVLYMYDAWGRVACYDGTDFGLATINPLMYRSYYLDVETGYHFYYLNSRYYLADLGRFVSADGYVQTGQGMLDKNMFAYCGNNPVMFRDPSGCSYEVTIKATGNSGWYSCTDPNYDVAFKNGTYTASTAQKSIANTIDYKKNEPDHPDYKPPKGGGKKVKNPNGKGKGWLGRDGGVWVWTPNMHGGEGWTVQYPGGEHKHAYPGGKVRSHYETNQNMATSAILVIGGVVVTTVLIADNVTGIGVADDSLLAGSISCIVCGLSQKHVCTECGGAYYGF